MLICNLSRRSNQVYLFFEAAYPIFYGRIQMKLQWELIPIETF